MSSKHLPPPEELQAALEDVRRIKRLIHDARESNSLRLVLRPMFRLGWFYAPIFFLYGVLAQWLLDASFSTWMGFSKTALLWGLSLFMVVLTGVIKQIVAVGAGRAQGISIWTSWGLIVGTSYVRLVFPYMTILLVLSALFIKIEHPEWIVGLLCMVYGAIFLSGSLALPFPNMTIAGVIAIVGGGLSFFVFPGFPFYKLAAVLGLSCLMMGFEAGWDAEQESTG